MSDEARCAQWNHEPLCGCRNAPPPEAASVLTREDTLAMLYKDEIASLRAEVERLTDGIDERDLVIKDLTDRADAAEERLRVCEEALRAARPFAVESVRARIDTALKRKEGK